MRADSNLVLFTTPVWFTKKTIPTYKKEQKEHMQSKYKNIMKSDMCFPQGNALFLLLKRRQERTNVKHEATVLASSFKLRPTQISFSRMLHDIASPSTSRANEYGKHDGQAVSFQNKMQHGCIIRMTLKKNNVFVNLTKTTGQTIIKFSAGLIQKKKNKKVLKPTVK